jgi:hypothetical protein
MHVFLPTELPDSEKKFFASRCKKKSILQPLTVGTYFSGQVDPTEKCKENLQGSTKNSDCSINLATRGHFTGYL